MGESGRIDHTTLHRIILDNGGKIVGGYVREWMVSGEPSDHGWSDIDCIFATTQGERAAILGIKESFGDEAPSIDVRQQTTHFTDFYCNCWEFDGKIKMIYPADSRMTFEELAEETSSKIARCIYSWWFSSRLQYRVRKLILRGWTIHHPNKEPVSSGLLNAIIRGSMA